MIRPTLIGVAAAALLGPAAAHAQFPVVGADDVRVRLAGKERTVLVDARPASEYLEAHIPGAINVPADRVGAEAKRLPRNRRTPLIVYCRGGG